MQKEKMKNNTNLVGANDCAQNKLEQNVGASIARSHFEEITENKKGITLIALIITIIVMLILVGVTVSIALNGGLFKTAKDAAKGTEAERDKEIALSEGKVEVDGVWYETMDDYLNNKPMIILPEGWTKTEKPEGWSDKITAITDGENTIPLPNGFEISKEEGENTIEKGVVIKDGANEFVWIPVANAGSYTEDSFGPLTDIHGNSGYPYDSQEILDYYYGEGYYDYADFTYEEDKTKVERSIQTYGGFYVGRYETTIDGNTIGVQKGKKVLTAYDTIKEGTSPNSNEVYYYRWWGLYKVQKDMYANNETVGSLMISSKQWDEIMDYTGYGSAKRPTDSYTTTPDLSGVAYSTDASMYDVSKNIYDLAGNVFECTMKPYDDDSRVGRGGGCSAVGYPASSSSSDTYGFLNSIRASLGSRVALCIK